MCIRAGEDELDTVKAIMGMSLSAIIADVFQRDLDNIEPQLHIYADLNMDEQKRLALAELIARDFDDLQVDFSRIEVLADLFEQVVGSAFEVCSS